MEEEPLAEEGIGAHFHIKKSTWKKLTKVQRWETL